MRQPPSGAGASWRASETTAFCALGERRRAFGPGLGEVRALRSLWERVGGRAGIYKPKALAAEVSSLEDVTSHRAQAYVRVIKTIEDLGASKLHAHEQEAIREAADALLFSDDLREDRAAREALDAVNVLIDRLVESGRMLPETAGELTADVESCGPLAPMAQAA
jgi:hypothetical protein